MCVEVQENVQERSLACVCVEVHMNVISPPHPTPQENMSATQQPPRERVNMKVNSPPHPKPLGRDQDENDNMQNGHDHTFGY